MPVLPPAAGGIRWEVHAKQGDDANIENVLHLFQNTGSALSQSQLNTLAAGCKTAWDNRILPLQVPSLQMTEHVLTDLTSPTGPQTILSDTNVGSGAGTISAAGLALVVQERTLLRGKSFRGRIYIGGINEGNLNDPQHWLGALITAANSALAGLVSDLAALTPAVTLAIVSYYGPPTIKAGSIAPGVPKRNKSTLRAAGVVNSVTTLTVNSRVGSQRRRNL